MPLDTAPYDALLLVSFGGPEKPEDVLPVPGERHPRPRHPARAARGGRRALLRLRRPQPDQRPEPRVHRRGGGGLPVHRHRPARLLGQPQLGPLPRRHAAADEGRRDPAGRLPGDERLLVVLRVPAVPREPRRGRRRPSGRARRGSTGCGTTSTTRASWSRWSTRRCPRSPDLGDAARRDAHVLFVTHSIPDVDERHRRARTGGAYVAQHRAVVDEVGERVRQETGHRYPTELVFCSRSGPPHVPWLEPDVNDRIEELAEHGVGGVVVVPIGFVSDHMEVIYDLDTEAQATAEKVGIEFARAATAGRRPALRGDGPGPAARAGGRRARRGGPPRPASGGSAPSWDRCPVGCCPNPRGDKPALCGQA